MKEIIKYLRQLNSLTQDEVAKKLGITRQSYIKYENGKVIPSEKMIEKMAVLYKVSTDYIYNNKLPKPERRTVTYSSEEEQFIFVKEDVPSYSASNKKTYDAWFDGKTVRVNDFDFKFTKGQRFKIIVEDEDEVLKCKDEAWENIKKIIHEKEKPFKVDDDDLYYKKALMDVLDEKYNSVKEFIDVLFKGDSYE